MADIEVEQGSAVEQGSGWLTFAAVVLIIAGIMRIFDAIWAWSYNGVLPDEFQEALFGNDMDTYGWIWLIVGIILIAAGAYVTQGAQWARWVGVLAGAILAISAVWWLPIYPVWSLVYILIGIFVIYGLIAFGARSTTA
jgi:hypothetical protein